MKDLYKKLVEFTHDGVYRYRYRDGKILLANPGFVEILELDCEPDDLVGKYLKDLIQYEEKEGKVREEIERKGGEVHGYEYCFQTLAGRRKWVIHDSFLTEGPQTGERVVNAIVKDITARKETELALRQSEKKVRRAYSKMERVYESTVAALTAAMRIKDTYTANHQTRTSRLAVLIGRTLELDQDRVNALEIAGQMHDIGKLAIPSGILNKPGPLNEHEYGLVQTHVEVGSEFLETADFPWPVERYVQEHHERQDGSGYPRGIGPEDMTEEGKVLAVSDVVAAMTAHRPYRPAYPTEAAVNEISDHRGNLYDPEVVDACLSVVEKGGMRDVNGAVPE